MPKERPETLTAPHDGQTLEGIIGDLQSRWGVPQYPQEYRITLKVADEQTARDAADTPAAPEPAPRPGREPAPADEGPRREKAPAAPRFRAGESTGRRGRRRRRRRGGSSS